MERKILIVDDEADIREILQFNLENAGFAVDCASSAEEALEVLPSSYSLILLDVMMGGMSGFAMAEVLRKERNCQIPIIFLTAKSSQTDLLTGFSAGGDDYIPKPFSIKEVLARVNAVLSRCHYNSANEEVTTHNTENKIEYTNPKSRFVFGKLVVDASDKRVYIGSEEILLTKKECEILILLTQHCNKIFSREDILKLVWKNESYVLERTVDVHIARLRKKLHEYGNLIVNRSGYGYCFQPQE